MLCMLPRWTNGNNEKAYDMLPRIRHAATNKSCHLQAFWAAACYLFGHVDKNLNSYHAAATDAFCKPTSRAAHPVQSLPQDLPQNPFQLLHHYMAHNRKIHTE